MRAQNFKRAKHACSHHTMTVGRGILTSQSERSISRYLRRSLRKHALKKIALLSRERTTEKRFHSEDFKTFKMSTLTSNFVPQPAVYRASVDRSLKKSRLAKDVPLPEVPKVIDNGNGRRYFRGRLLGKVNFVSTTWLVWI